jgi:hypothetical protein
MKRVIAIVVTFCALVGAAVGAVAMYTGWEHNPQGTYYEVVGDSRVVHLGYWGLLGLWWFLVVFVPLFLSAAVSSPCRITSISEDLPDSRPSL